MFPNKGAPSSTDVILAMEVDGKVDGNGQQDPDLEKPFLPLDAGYEEAMEASVKENPQALITSI